MKEFWKIIIISKKLKEQIDISLVEIIRLTPTHDYLPFDCLDPDLNDFLHNDAKDYLSKLLSVTYVVEYDGKTVAFFSLSNDKISHEENSISNRLFKRLFQDLMPEGKKYKSYPAVKLGRFAVHSEYQNKGWGSKLLDYIKGMFIIKNKTGCQFITVDAYRKSLLFYERNGFKYFGDTDINKDTRQMYCNLTDLVS